MPLRIPLLAAFLFALFGATIATSPATAFDPKANERIVDLADLETYRFEIYRELTGAAAQRIHAIYLDSYDDIEGFIPARYPANGRFSLLWEGDVENPDRYVQRLTVGNNEWVEWSVNGRAKGRYNDDALLNNVGSRPEAQYWWDENIGSWLAANVASLDCETATKLINDEQSVRCTAPSLTLTQKIRLLDTVGIYTEEDTKAVSAFEFELWLTKSDNIPVRMDISGTATDTANATFSGKFSIDIWDIDSPDISVALPRD